MKKVLPAVYLLALFTACTDRNVGVNRLKISDNGDTPLRISENGDTIRLSQQGILSDASLEMNSTTFSTDQTEAIQSVIDAAPAGKIIKFDTKSSGRQVALKGGITYYFDNTNGLIQRDGANVPFIVNKNRTNGTIVDSDIIIKGPGIINGNGFRNGVEKQIKETLEGWAITLKFAGVKNLLVD